MLYRPAELAQDLARDAKLKFSPDDLTSLVEAVGCAPARVAVEIEKLRLFLGEGAQVTAEHIASLVPQAQATTIFALVNALGRNDRRKALDLLDVLVREGEYLPLALSFLASQFRQALVAQEANLRSAGQVQGYFSKWACRCGGRARAGGPNAQRVHRRRTAGRPETNRPDRCRAARRPAGRSCCWKIWW